MQQLTCILYIIKTIFCDILDIRNFLSAIDLFNQCFGVNDAYHIAQEIN